MSTSPVEATPAGKETDYRAFISRHSSGFDDEEPQEDYMDQLLKQEDEYQESLLEAARLEADEFEENAATYSGGAQKRIRIQGKQTVNRELYQISSSAHSQRDVELPVTDTPKWEQSRKARVLYGVHCAKARQKGEIYKDVFTKSKALFNTLPENEQERWRQMAAKKSSDRCKTSFIKDDMVFEEPPEDAESKLYQYSGGKLFTWNSSWLLDDQQYRDLIERWMDQSAIFCVLAQDLLCVKNLFSALDKAVSDAVAHFRCRQYSVCMEVSLNAEDRGRMHLHAFIERDCRADKAWAKWSGFDSRLRVLGVPVSHGQPCTINGKGRNRRRAMVEGHYYCQAPKEGHVMHFSTCPVYKSIFPDSKMVITLWRTRKMCTESARSEVLLTRDRVPGVISMLDSTRSLEYCAEMDVQAGRAEEKWARQPFLAPSDSEREWVKQYAVVALLPYMSNERACEFCSSSDMEESAKKRRFKFLIYDGPSRMGKTELARAWFGVSRTMIANAQECATPNLRPMLTGKFNAILFDEGNWELCARNKALFQASTRAVELSQSQCNDRSYTLMVFRVPMIICSNDFWAGCLDDEIKNWITENSFYVSVQKPVWQP